MGAIPQANGEMKTSKDIEDLSLILLDVPPFTLKRKNTIIFKFDRFKYIY